MVAWFRSCCPTLQHQHQLQGTRFTCRETVHYPRTLVMLGLLDNTSLHCCTTHIARFRPCWTLPCHHLYKLLDLKPYRQQFWTVPHIHCSELGTVRNPKPLLQTNIHWQSSGPAGHPGTCQITYTAALRSSWIPLNHAAQLHCCKSTYVRRQWGGGLHLACPNLIIYVDWNPRLPGIQQRLMHRSLFVELTRRCLVGHENINICWGRQCRKNLVGLDTQNFVQERGSVQLEQIHNCICGRKHINPDLYTYICI